MQTTIVDIEPGEVRLQINLTPGVTVAEQVLKLIDLNHDDAISTNEAAGYAELLKRDLVARIDGREVELKVGALNYQDPAELRTGSGIIQLEYFAAVPSLAAGPHQFTLENKHQPVASVYLFNAAQPKAVSLKVRDQKRNDTQSTGEIAFDFDPLSKPSRPVGIIVSLTAVFVVFAAGIYSKQKDAKARLGVSKSK